MTSPLFPSPRFLRTLTAACLFAVTAVPAVRADELMRQVQEELRKRNLYFGDVNGLDSPQVAAALRRYQQRKGFQPTGQADDTTLRSLSLVATAPPAAVASTTAATTATTSVPQGTAAATTVLPLVSNPANPWPDLPVLRSDLGRENSEPPAGSEEAQETPEPEPSPTPVRLPKPPPAAAFQNGFGEGGVRGYVENFLKQGESNDPDAQQAFFAEQVDYFNEGRVDRAFITKDTARYNKRWPVRQFNLVDPVRLSETPEGSPDRLVVNFRCRFHVKQAEHENKEAKEVKGEVENTYTLARNGQDRWQIVGVKEQRVRDK